MSTLRRRGPDQVLALRKCDFAASRKTVYVRDNVDGLESLREDGRSIVMRDGSRYVETNVFIDRSGRSEDPYEVFIAGAHPAGIALRVNFGRTVDEAVSKARSYIIPKEKTAHDDDGH